MGPSAYKLTKFTVKQESFFSSESHTARDYSSCLETLIKAEHLERQAGGTPADWANESLALAQAAWVQDGTNLDETYYQQQIKVVDRQMALAGLRLAKLLNETVGK